MTIQIAQTEQDIINHAEGKGSLNCALTGFRQGKKVLLCTSNTTKEELFSALSI